MGNCDLEHEKIKLKRGNEMKTNEGIQVLRKHTMAKGDQQTKPIGYTVTLDGWQLVALKIMGENYIEGEPMPDIHIESLKATLKRLDSATS